MTTKRKSPEEGLYSKVTRRIWISRDFLALSPPKPNAQTLWLRLLTGPELGQIPGLFRVTQAGLAEALGWPLPAFQRCFREITARKMATHDRATGLCWVPRAIHHNAPDNPNIVLGWRQAWKELPYCDLRDEARTYLGEWCASRGNVWVKVWGDVTGYVPPKRSPEPSPPGLGGIEREGEEEDPPNPQTSEIQTRAERWRVQADLAGGKGRAEADMAFGDPCRWPETRVVLDAFRDAWGRRDDPRHSDDPRCRVIVDRFASGFSPTDLAEAIRGSRRSDIIAEKREYQAIRTILRDDAQVDKFRALAAPQDPDRPPPGPADAEFEAAMGANAS